MWLWLKLSFPHSKHLNMLTRTHLGCVTPLGRPRSVYKSDVEWRVLELWGEMAKWPWRSRSMTPIFNTGWDKPKMHIWWKFGDSSSNPLKSIVWNSQISTTFESFSILAESISWCMFGANLVIPVQTVMSYRADIWNNWQSAGRYGTVDNDS